MSAHLRLGVNIDHVATIRNARGGIHPDPVQAALMAQAAGQTGSPRICAKTAAISAMPILTG
jgi:hypothetical protein